MLVGTNTAGSCFVKYIPKSAGIVSSMDVYLENKLLVLRPYQINFDSESKNKAQKSHIKDPWPLSSPNDFLHSGV